MCLFCNSLNYLIEKNAVFVKRTALLCTNVLSVIREGFVPRTVEIKHLKEHKKYFVPISQLESIGRQKLEEFNVSDTELLPTKYRNQLVRTIGEKLIAHAYIRNFKEEGPWDTGSMVTMVNKISLKNRDFIS